MDKKPISPKTKVVVSNITMSYDNK